MALKRLVQETQSESTVEYTNLEAGEHEGRLVYIGDLGLQRREWKGEEKPPTQQIALGIEIVGETVTIDGEEQPRMLWTAPFNIYQRMNENGKELPMFRVFVPQAKEGEIADWDSVLGMPCNVVVTHTKGKGEYADRTFDNISALSPIPAKYQKDVPLNKIEPAVGDSEDENNPATQALYGLARYVYDRRITGDIPAVREAPAKVVKDEDDFDDDLPF
jgi:hypothetical protein